MPRNILVASPYATLGDLLREQLDDGERFQVVAAQTGNEALAAASQTAFCLAVLDSDLIDFTLGSLSQILQEEQPEMQFVILEARNAGVFLDDLPPHTLLPRTLSPEETRYRILSLVDAEHALPPRAVFPADLAWLEEEGLRETRFASLLLQTTAQGLVVAQPGRCLACSTGVALAEGQEIARLLQRQWNRETRRDLARHLYLPERARAHFLYASPIVTDVLLAVLFEPGTPLTYARQQVRRLIEGLPSQPPAAQILAVEEPPDTVESFLDRLPEVEGEDLPLSEAEQISLAELLSDLPSPDPEQDEFVVPGWEPELPAAVLDWTPPPPPKSPDTGPLELLLGESAWEKAAEADGMVRAEESGAQEAAGSEWNTEEAAPAAPMPAPVPEEEITLMVFIETLNEPAAEETSTPEAELDEPVAEDIPTVEAELNEPVPEEIPTPEAELEEPVTEDIPTVEAELNEPVLEEIPTPEAELEETAAEDIPMPETELDEPLTEDIPMPETELDEPLTEDIPTPETELEEPVTDEIPTPEAELEEPVMEDAPAPEPTEDAPLPVLFRQTPQEDEYGIPLPPFVFGPSAVEDRPPARPLSALLGEAAPTAVEIPANGDLPPALAEAEQSAEAISAAPIPAEPPAAEEAPIPASAPISAASAMPTLLPWETRSPQEEITRPSESSLGFGSSRILAPPVSDAIAYTCVLIPRVPNHYLAGDLSDLLHQALPRICQAFGWMLDSLNVHVDYLQWSVTVTPGVSPGNLARIVRQRTSDELFRTYPRLLDQNLTGDFWAPGYLVVRGEQLTAPQLLREFIQQTRRRQGYE